MSLVDADSTDTSC